MKLLSQILILLSGLPLFGQSLTIEPGVDAGSQKLKIEGEAEPGTNLLLHFSDDARTWFPIAGSRTLPWQFIDTESAQSGKGFYRTAKNPLAMISNHPSWRDRVSLPDDPFKSEPVLTGYGQTEIRWIKFSIILGNAPTVYFQDSNEYQFHYNFANARLDPFADLSLDEFNAATLHPPEQEIVLGALLFAPAHKECAYEFVGREPYPPAMLRYLYQLVDDAVDRPDDWSALYIPTYEQAESARENADFFQRNEISLGSIARWQNSDACYSGGWALGRLVFVPGAEIEDAFRSGSLLTTDVLITDGVPAEVPYVAGIITISPGTPNSHVAILARSYGVPFVFLSDDASVAEALDLVGKDIVLRSNSRFSGECQIDVFEARDLTVTYRADILDLKRIPPLEVTARETFGALTMDVVDASLSDIRYIGGKAANFSLLRQTIPDSSPNAMAFTFDLWEAYLEQTIAGKSLRETIIAKLAHHTWPPNISALDADLKAIRDLMKDDADFSPTLRNTILAELQAAGFSPMEKLRFRSSTNVEDSDQFVGAGLYDSFSGCLQDDLDDDDEGPSHCDPDKEEERGVLRAMKKVYASFYNLNAYLQRLRRGVNENEVGMAILVHHSFPDATEAANGVISGSFQSSGNTSYLFSETVTQLGAVSVTNPNGKSIPELVECQCTLSALNSGCNSFFQERSSLLPTGNFSIMAWREDYHTLNSMALEVARAYQLASGIDRFSIEFEFKKLTNGSLIIKQVRRVPEITSSGSGSAALVNRPVTLEVFQGETADLFSNHNLKLRLQAETTSNWLDAAGTKNSFLTKSDWLHHREGTLQQKTGAVSTWNGASFAVRDFFGTDHAVDSWIEPDFKGGRAELEFRFQMPSSNILATQPIRVIGDMPSQLLANFSEPQLTFEYQAGFTTTTTQAVWLTPSVTDQPLPPGSLKKTRSHLAKSGAGIEINFFWPPAPTGPIAGYTAPLQKWDVTTITGLTTEPIELRGYFSQTYRPGHHNFTEEFLFEPRLEEGISPATLTELETLDIKQIYLHFGTLIPEFKAIGFDDQVRDLR